MPNRSISVLDPRLQPLAKELMDQATDYITFPLTQGKFSKIDRNDLFKIIPYKWHYHRTRWASYASMKIKKNGKRTTIFMHRFLLDVPNNKEIDHKNKDGLDNRKSNLRICTSSQNKANMRKRKNTSSKFKGVTWLPKDKVWICHTQKDGKIFDLGRFKNEIEAARAYNKKALKLFGEFALLNNI